METHSASYVCTSQGELFTAGLSALLGTVDIVAAFPNLSKLATILIVALQQQWSIHSAQWNLKQDSVVEWVTLHTGEYNAYLQ